MFNVGLKRKRIDILEEAAIDHGFTQFDTAPYYGFGWAENDQGAVLQTRPSVTVITKLAIYSAGGEDQSQISMLLRKPSASVLPALPRSIVDFAVSRSNLSRSQGLIRLQQDRVAVYRLYKPQLGLQRSKEWQRRLEDPAAQGQVGNFGLALTANRLLPFIQSAPSLGPLVQVLPCKRQADLLVQHCGPHQINYGHISEASPNGERMPVDDLLRAAVLRNRHSALIVNTTRVERLCQSTPFPTSSAT